MTLHVEILEPNRTGCAALESMVWIMHKVALAADRPAHNRAVVLQL